MPSTFSLCRLVILFLSVEFSTVSCDTFYIVTSPSSPCPGEYIGVPCLTLQQYASNPSRSQNITFLVEPGMYNLSTVLTVSDGYNFTMSSTNATVMCTSTTARFEFNRVENVHISGMTFQGCSNTAAVQMLRVPRALTNASNFINNGRVYHSTGRAIYAPYQKVLIDKSCFNNNIANYENGGAIYVQDSNITIENSEFSNNFAYYSGGAIYIYNRNGNFEFRINGTILYGNRAYRRGNGGGAIYMYLNPYYRYRVTFDFQLNNTLFYCNQAIQGDGGAIYMYDYNYYVSHF